MIWLNVLSLLLIVVTFVSYILQYHRLFILGSSAGLSVASVLLNTLVGQAQVVNMYHLFKSSPSMRYGIPIATPYSTRDWINLAQILTQCICTLLLFALVIYLPTSATGSSAPKGLSKTVAVLLWILHPLLIILAVAAEGRQPNIEDYFGLFTIIRWINVFIFNYLFTLIAFVAFFLQARAMPLATDQPNSWSKWILGFQFFTFLLLAISWPFRLLLPPNLWELGEKPAILLSWYPWVGWACVNNAILAVGQGIMLFLFVSSKIDDTVTFAAEHQHLLGSDEL